MRKTEVQDQADKLLQRLAESPAFAKVTAFVEDRRLVLEGCVESYAAKHEAETIARHHGFTDIDNCLRVYPCEEPAPVRPET